MALVFVSIGSNINKELNIPASLRALQEKYQSINTSSIYESEAIEFIGNKFFNLVIGFESTHPVVEIITALQAIEKRLGRVRKKAKFSSRSIDLDLLLYGNKVIAENNIQIPRDEILKYAFVLQPLAEIAPQLKHPVSGQTFKSIWNNFDKSKQEIQLAEFQLN